MKSPAFYLSLPHLRGMTLPPDVPVGDVPDGACQYTVLHAFSHPQWRSALGKVWSKLGPGGVLSWWQPHTGIARKEFGAWGQSLKSGWDCIEDDDDFDGGYFTLWRKREDGQQNYDPFTPAPNKVLVYRPGGLGDGLCAASIFRALHEEGAEVTFLTTPEAAKTVRGNPWVREILAYDVWRLDASEVQPMLAAYARHYPRVINLNETYEGQVLFAPGRSNYSWDAAARRRVAAHINVEELTFEVAGLEFRPGEMRFHPTEAECEAAALEAMKLAALGERLMVWPIHGSAEQKFYPHTGAAVARALAEHPDLVCAFTGGEGRDDAAIEQVRTQAAQFYGEDVLRRMVNLVGLPVRVAYALAQRADLVAGPETGLMNAVAYESPRKVILLSHSSPDNLPKHWRSTQVLTPRCDLYPCVRMHGPGSECPADPQTGRSACASSIAIEAVTAAISAALMGRSIAEAA